MTTQIQLDKEAADALLDLQINRTDPEDRQLWTLRMLLIFETETPSDLDDYYANHSSPDMDCTKEEAYTLVQQLNRMRNEQWGLGRETLTQLALQQSLCPIHYIDYAACFDDDDPTCSQVRFIHPNHDT